MATQDGGNIEVILTSATVELPIISASPIIEVSVIGTGPAGQDGLGVPAGGTTGQVLAKVSDADNDTEWVDVAGDAGDITYDPTEEYQDGSVGKAMQSMLTTDALPTDIASGAIASFPDGAALDAKDITIAIEPVQDLNGYGSPWPAGGGKNKFLTTLETTTVNGITFNVNADGTIKITGEATGNVSNKIFGTVTLGAGTYIASGLSNGAASGAGTWRLCFHSSETNSIVATVYQGRQVTFTITESSTITVYPVILVGANFATTPTTFEPMIRLSSESDGTYVPYSNICPITGWTGANVYRAALYGLGPLENYGLSDNGSVNTFDTYEHSDYIDLTGVNSVSISFKGGSPGGWTYRVCGYDANKAFVELIDKKNLAGGNYSYTYDVTNYSFLRVSLVDNCENVVFTAEKETIPISFSSAGTVYGGTLDVTTGVLTVTHGYVDLGTRTWTRNTAGTFPYFNSAYFDEAARPASISLKCSAYKAIANVNGTSFRASAHNGEICIDRQSARPAIMIQDSTYSDADTFKTALSGVQLVYELATPQTYQLTPQEVQLLAGENNIWADTGDSTVTYKADIGLYIQKLTGSTEEDMVANQNIASGKYFMVGNSLYLSTAAIAAGATIVPGTNCTLTNLAAALNALNS